MKTKNKEGSAAVAEASKLSLENFGRVSSRLVDPRGVGGLLCISLVYPKIKEVKKD